MISASTLARPTAQRLAALVVARNTPVESGVAAPRLSWRRLTGTANHEIMRRTGKSKPCVGAVAGALCRRGRRRDCCVTRRRPPGKKPLPVGVKRKVLAKDGQSDAAERDRTGGGLRSAAEMDISPSTCGAHLGRSGGLKPHYGCRRFKLSNDPQFERESDRCRRATTMNRRIGALVLCVG